jgi:hypothetical protein
VSNTGATDPLGQVKFAGLTFPKKTEATELKIKRIDEIVQQALESRTIIDDKSKDELKWFFFAALCDAISDPKDNVLYAHTVDKIKRIVVIGIDAREELIVGKPPEGSIEQLQAHDDLGRFFEKVFETTHLLDYPHLKSADVTRLLRLVRDLGSEDAGTRKDAEAALKRAVQGKGRTVTTPSLTITFPLDVGDVFSFLSEDQRVTKMRQDNTDIDHGVKEVLDSAPSSDKLRKPG